MSKELQLSIGITGLTVTAKLYLNGVIANGGTPVACPEYAGQGGLYQGNMPALAAGEYYVQFFSAGVVQSAGNIDWDGTNQITLQTIATQIGAGLTGPNAVTITVKDANNVALQGARVTVMQNSIVTAAWTTNVSGLPPVNISLPPGAYTLNVYLPGYQPSSTTIVVSGVYTSTINLSILVITPSTAPLVTGYLVLYDDNNAPVSGGVVNVELLVAPGAGRGDGLGLGSETSGVTGLVQFLNMLALAQYRIQWGPDGDWVDFVTTAAATQELPNIRQG